MDKRKRSNKKEERVSTFITKVDMNQMINYGREYMKDFINHKVTLYRINQQKTYTDDLYGESYAHEKSYLPAVVLNVIAKVEDYTAENRSGSGINHETYKLSFKVYEKELQEKEVDIKKGDYVVFNTGYKDETFEVTEPNYKNTSTNQTIGGTKPYIRSIMCVYVQEDISLDFEDTETI